MSNATTIRTPDEVRAEIAAASRDLGEAHVAGKPTHRLLARLDELHRELAASEAAVPILAERARAAKAEADAQAARETEAARESKREQRAAIAAEVDAAMAALAEAHARLEAVDISYNDRTALRCAFSYWCPVLAPYLGVPRVRGDYRHPLAEMLK